MDTFTIIGLAEAGSKRDYENRFYNKSICEFHLNGYTSFDVKKDVHSIQYILQTLYLLLFTVQLDILTSFLP